jgi:hypothetical protein
MLVLAASRRSCVGVNLRTGALVRTHQPMVSTERLEPYDTAHASIAHQQIARADQPESVEIATPLSVTGSMYGWRVDRILRNVSHPERVPLFGCGGPAMPFWSLDGDRPSVSIVPATSSLSVSIDHRGVRCRFLWNNGRVDLPLEDPTVLSMLDWLPSGPLHGPRLNRAVGFRPNRLVIALSRPIKGYCYKVVAGLLPAP